MTSPTLFELIRQTEQLLDAIASSAEYRLLQDNEGLSNLDVTLGDVELFLMQLNQALGAATESESGSQYPTFEELFGEDSLSNSLTLLEPRKLSLNEIMNRPLPPIDPQTEQELAELEEFFHGGNQP